MPVNMICPWLPLKWGFWGASENCASAGLALCLPELLALCADMKLTATIHPEKVYSVQERGELQSPPGTSLMFFHSLSSDALLQQVTAVKLAKTSDHISCHDFQNTLIWLFHSAVVSYPISNSTGHVCLVMPLPFHMRHAFILTVDLHDKK